MTHFPKRASSDETVGLISWRHLAEYLAGPLCGWDLGGYDMCMMMALVLVSLIWLLMNE